MAQYVLNLVFGIREGTLDVESKAIGRACETLDFGGASVSVNSLMMKRSLLVDFEARSLDEAKVFAKGVAERLEDIRGTSYSSVIHDLHWQLKDKEDPKILAKGEILAESTSYVESNKTKKS